MNIKVGFVIFFSALLLGNSAFAQDVSVDLIKKHSPTRATIYSAVLPGLGQAYNHNYWKIPVIYAGGAAFAYGIYFYNDLYKDWEKKYNYYDDKLLNEYTREGAREMRNGYRRWRDMCIIGTSAWYLLNILEAYVYANLFDFDVSDNLSFRISPTLMPTAHARLSAGLNISFSF